MPIRPVNSAFVVQPLQLLAGGSASTLATRPAGLISVGMLLRVTGRRQTAAVAGDEGLARQRAIVEDIRRLVAAPSPASVSGASGSRGPFSTWPVTETRLHTIASTALFGRNAAQVAQAGVAGLAPFSRYTITGEVLHRRSGAELTVLGGSGATTTAGGTYELAGNLGSAAIQFAADQPLAAVAQQINDRTAQTGVAARIDGDNLVLSSTTTGSAAAIRLTPLDVPPRTIVTSNSEQIDALSVLSQTPGTTETLTGSHAAHAQGAELVYRGQAGGLAAGTASFRLAGTRGEATLSITRGESLAAVAQRINDQTASTGIVATVAGSDLRLNSDTVGSGALVRVDAVQPAYETVISGVNPSQIAGLTVVSLADGSEQVLTGNVLRTASAASLALQGTAIGTVIDTATFKLTGNLGQTTISIAGGESLSGVAARVNAASGSTGVLAEASGSQLVFRSADLGSAATVQIELVHVAHTTTVSGVSAQQLAGFQVQQFTEGATQTLSGTVTQTAGQAELTFNGVLSLVGTNSTFRLSGSLGSVQLSTTALQSLSSLATQINASTAATGVTATVQGSQLKLRSSGVGSNATVGVQVLSGTFNVSGGNGNGTANGTNAKATINGQALTGLGNQFQLTDSLGTYTFTTASGFTGMISPITIRSLAGSFGVSGGNGDGTAAGLDARAEINGTTYTGAANRLSIGAPGGQFDLDLAAGYAGTLGPITIRSVPHEFQVEGGDGLGQATGAAARATINGQELLSDGDQFLVAGEHGTYRLQFAPDFNGPFDPVTIESRVDLLQTQGADADGAAHGHDTEALINGRLLVSQDSQFQFGDGGVDVSLWFRPDFVGPFDPIVAASLTKRFTETVRTTETRFLLSATLTPEAPREAPEPDPYGLLLDELHGLLAEKSGSKPAGGEAVAPADARPDRLARRAQILSQQLAPLSQAANRTASDSPWQAVEALRNLAMTLDLLA